MESYVESDLEAQLGGPVAELPEVLDSSQLGMDGGVAPLRPADCPRHSRVVGAGFEGVVGALAVGAPDGVDGREVEDVESHLRHVVEPVGHVGEGSVLALVPPRTGEQLVPGGKTRPLAVHPDLVDRVVDRRAAAVGEEPHGVGHLRGECRFHPDLDRPAPVPEQGCGGGEELGSGVVLRPFGGVFDQAGADLEVRFFDHVGVALLRQPEPPGGEVVDPAFDREREPSDVGDGELSPPAVVDHGLHGHPPPGRLPAALVADVGGDGVVAVGEDVRLHRHHVADDALRRETSVVDAGRDVLDDDPAGGGEAHGAKARNRWIRKSAPAHAGTRSLRRSSVVCASTPNAPVTGAGSSRKPPAEVSSTTSQPSPMVSGSFQSSRSPLALRTAR